MGSKIDGIVNIGSPKISERITTIVPQCYTIENDKAFSFVDKLVEREVVRFFSEKQIEEYFASRVEDASYGDARRWFEGWCVDHKAICGGNVYTADDLMRVCVDPFNPVRCLPYLGF